MSFTRTAVLADFNKEGHGSSLANSETGKICKYRCIHIPFNGPLG